MLELRGTLINTPRLTFDAEKHHSRHQFDLLDWYLVVSDAARGRRRVRIYKADRFSTEGIKNDFVERDGNANRGRTNHGTADSENGPRDDD